MKNQSNQTGLFSILIICLAILEIPLGYYCKKEMVKLKVGGMGGLCVMNRIFNKYFIIFSFSIVFLMASIPCFSQGKITEEEKYFYNLKVYYSYLLEENPLNVFPRSGRQFTDLRAKNGSTRWCRSWYEAWLYTYYYEQFIQASKDEFEFKAFVNSKTDEFKNKYRNVNFSKTFLYKGSSNFGDYDFSNKGFYLKLNEAFPISEFPVFNYYENFNNYTFLSMNEEDAKLFLQKRKDVNGVVNRRLNIETTYSIMNRVMKENKLYIYIQKVTIYDGAKILKVIYPKTNYFDKVRGISLQNGVEKVYFDENWNKLYNNDTLRATYNSTIKYKNGSVINPLLSGIYCCNYRQGYAYSSPGKATIKLYYEEDAIKIEGKNFEGNRNGVPYTDIFIRSVNDPFYYYSKYDPSLSFYVLNETSFSFVKTGTVEPYSRYLEQDPTKIQEIIQTPSSAIEPTIKSDNRSKIPLEDVSNVKINNDHGTNFIGHFNNDMPTGDYILFDKNVYYKARGLEIAEIAIEDINRNPITDSRIKLGSPIFLKIKIKRLAKAGGKFQYLLANHVEDTEGTVYSSESANQEINDESAWISIAGGIRRMVTNSSTKETYMSFKIKDRNSDAIIQGFLKFTVFQ